MKRKLVELGGHDPSSPPLVGQSLGDRTRASAEIYRSATRRQALDRAKRERLALPARDIDTFMNLYLETAERHFPGYPSEWLAGQAAVEERSEKLGVTRRALEKLGGLFACGDTAGAREQSGERVEVLRDRHRGNLSTQLVQAALQAHCTRVNGASDLSSKAPAHRR